MTHTKRLIYLSFDFLILNTALLITYYWFFDGSGFVTTQEFKGVMILINLLWLATLFYSNRLYRQFEYTSLMDEIKSLVPNYVVYILLFYLLSISYFQDGGLSLSFYYGSLLVILMAGRIFIKYITSRISKYKTLNYITIGFCDALPKIEQTLIEAHLGKINHIASFDNNNNVFKNSENSAEAISRFLQTNKINLILYVSNTLPPSVVKQLIEYARRNFIDFKIIPIEIDILTEGAKLELHNGLFLSAKDEYVAHLRAALIKRAFDIVFSLLVIVGILSWLFPIICILICMESKGSPIFIQDRVGFRGRVFKCFKFRSMTVRENGQMVIQAQRNDSRVTKMGAFLRRTNLDEMPQFINVLLGDMSVVGPRPHAVSHDNQFKNTAEDYILRHYSKPGITGWAQVNGWRGPTDTDSKIFNRTQYDLWYVRNRSLILDIKIIFLTVFSGKAWDNVF